MISAFNTFFFSIDVTHVSNSLKDKNQLRMVRNKLLERKRILITSHPLLMIPNLILRF